jgi:hypothetical protein
MGVLRKNNTLKLPERSCQYPTWYWLARRISYFHKSVEQKLSKGGSRGKLEPSDRRILRPGKIRKGRRDGYLAHISRVDIADQLQLQK